MLGIMLQSTAGNNTINNAGKKAGSHVGHLTGNNAWEKEIRLGIMPTSLCRLLQEIRANHCSYICDVW